MAHMLRRRRLGFVSGTFLPCFLGLGAGASGGGVRSTLRILFCSHLEPLAAVRVLELDLKQKNELAIPQESGGYEEAAGVVLCAEE